MTSALSPIVRCPYCAAELAGPPKRMTRCPACRQPIVVRSKAVRLFDRVLLTEREALVADTFPQLESLGVTASAFQQQLATRPQSASRAADALWTLWNEAVLARPDLAESQYVPMALFVNAEGRDARYLLEAKHRTTLSRLKRYSDTSGLGVTVQVLSSGDGCAACERLSGSTFPLDVALSDMPLPVKDCTYMIPPGQHPFCRCVYLVDIDV